MEAAVNDHNKEYKRFHEYKISDVLKTCNQSSPLLSDTKEIYPPLFATLCTDSGMGFLSHLNQFHTLSTFKKSIRQLKNRLYYIGERSHEEEVLQHIEKPIHWPLKYVKNLDDVVPAPEELADHTFETIAKETARKFKLRQHLNDTIKPSPLGALENDAFKVPAASHQEAKDQYSKAVAAHAAFLIQLKERHYQEEAAPLTPFVAPMQSLDPDSAALWDHSLGMPITRIHLFMILGPDYKKATDFGGNQKQADIANLKEYLTRYNTPEYDQKYTEQSEFKRKITPLESDYGVLAQGLDWESQIPWPTFWHAANADQNNLTSSFTVLRKFWMLDPLIGLIALRGHDLYFRLHKTMQDVRTDLGHADYEKDRNSQVVCFNFPFTAGRATSETSSNSIEYLLNNHSVRDQDISGRYQEAMALAGFNNPDYGFFNSVFQQHLAHLGGDMENSVLVACSVNPSVLRQYSYAAYGGGRPYEMDVKECSPSSSSNSSSKHTTDSPLYVLYNLQQEYRRLSSLSAPESFTAETERKQKLTPELRLHAHPDLTLSSKHIRFKTFLRFGGSEKMADFNEAMMINAIDVIADWLAQETTVMPESLIQYPLIKTLYHLIHEGLTGEKVKESVSFHGLEFLIEHGHLSGVKSFVTLFPQLLEQFATIKEKRKAVASAIFSGNAELINYLTKELFKTDIRELFPPEEMDFKILIRSLCLGLRGKGEVFSSFSYLMNQLDPSSISLQLKTTWFNLILSEFTCGKNLSHVAKYFSLLKYWLPEQKEEILEKLLVLTCEYSTAAFQECSKVLLKSTIFTTQDIFIRMIPLLRNPPDSCFKEHIQALIQQGADPFAINSESKDSFIFAFIDYSRTSENYLQEIINFLKTPQQKSQFKTIKNQAGLTPLQYLQKLYVERKKPTTFLSYNWRDIYESDEIQGASYSPFAQFFGVSLNTVIEGQGIDPLLFEESRTWIEEIDSAKTFEKLKEHLLKCPSSSALKIISPKLKRLLPYEACYLVNHSLYNAEQKWLSSFNDAFAAKDDKGLAEILKTVPFSFGQHEIIIQHNQPIAEELSIAMKNTHPLKEKTKQDWEKKFEDILISQDFRALSNHILSSPFRIMSEEMDDKLKPYHFDLESHFNQLQKAENEWAQKSLGKLNTPSSTPLLFDEVLKTAPNAGARQQLFPYLLNDKVADHLPPYLEAVFPDKYAFSMIADLQRKESNVVSMLTLRNILYSSPLCAKHILLHIGPFADRMLKTLFDHDVTVILSQLTRKELESFTQQCPDILHYKDGIRDFFTAALSLPKSPWKTKFCLENVRKLKECYQYAPYVMFLVDDLDTLDQVYESDPSVLNATTSEGIEVQELLNLPELPMSIKTWLRTKLAPSNE